MGSPLRHAIHRDVGRARGRAQGPVTVVVMHDVSLALSRLASPFTKEDAEASGISQKVLRRLVQHGEVVRVRHGVYVSRAVALASYDAAYRRDIAAAATSFGPDYAVSHLSAAALHGLPLPLGPPGPVHLTRLTACHRSRQSRRGVVIHHADSSITPVESLAGLIVTSIDRTLADCLRSLPLTGSVPIVDAALFRERTTEERVRDYLEVQRRWGGVPLARRGLALADGRRETWLESYSFVRLDQLGVELPTPQVWVYDEWDLRVGRVDGIWREGATVAEMDGRGKYLVDGPDQVAVAEILIAEKEREDRLRDLGLEMVRWGLDDLRRNPGLLVSRIHAARARGDWRRFRGRILPHRPDRTHQTARFSA